MKQSSILVISLCLALIGLHLTPTSHAATYRWVDANGVVNYAERRPKGVPEDRITVIGDATPRPAAAPSASDSANLAPANSNAPADNSELTDEQQQRLARMQQAEQERQQKIAQAKQDNCDKSRKALADLTAKERVRINMPDGSQRILGEDERQEFIAQAQNGIVRNCEA